MRKPLSSLAIFYCGAISVCLAQTQLTLSSVATYSEVNDLTPAQPSMTQPFRLDAATNADITIVSASTTLKVSLIDSDGGEHQMGAFDSVVTSSSTYSTTGDIEVQNYMFGLASPKPGIWKYHVIETAALAGPHAVLFTVFSSSPISVRLLGGGDDYPVNRDIPITLLVVDPNGPVTASSLKSIQAVVKGDDGTSLPINFVDDGKGFDSTANDGVFTATFQLATAGSYTLGVTVAGTSSNGDFVRTASARFRTVSPCGSLSATAQTAVVDLNNDGRIGALDVTFTVSPNGSGQFVLFATLAVPNGNSVSETAAFSSSGGGGSQQSVRFPAADLQSLGVNGPYQISAARLECISSGDTQVSDRQFTLGPTVAVDLTQLERPPVILAGNNSDAGVDTNGNGLFDRLDLNIGVNVLSAGAYTWSASLFAANRTQVGYASGSGNLTAAANAILLSFDGTSIGRAGVDGPYAIRNLVVTAAGQTTQLGAAGSTSAYRFDQFEGAPARLASNAVVNGASFLAGAIAPGQVVSIFGNNLGPTTGVGLQFAPGSSTVISTNLAGVVVTFNGIAAPLFFVRADQINCQVPIELAGQTTATVTVTYQNQVVTGTAVQVVPVASTIFTIAGGNGLAAMLNQDGSVHSVSNPAKRGSVIQIYMTGQGLVQPPLANGQLVPPTVPFPAPALPVSVTIGGRPAQVPFAGMAPNLVGLFQVNAVVPADTPPGSAVPLVVTIGTVASQPGVMIAVSESTSP